MKNKLKIILTTCVIVLLGLVLINAIRHLTEDTTLSEKQIASRVEALYGGTVDHIIKQGAQYMTTFSTKEGTYEVAVDEANGRFSNLTLIYKKTTVTEQNLNDEASPSDTIDDNDLQADLPVEQPQEDPILLTEQQVIAIVQTQFSGEIEDIDYKQTADGGYYLMEIDTETEEIIVQIHAITGKILSVSFDD